MGDFIPTWNNLRLVLLFSVATLKSSANFLTGQILCDLLLGQNSHGILLYDFHSFSGSVYLRIKKILETKEEMLHTVQIF